MSFRDIQLQLQHLRHIFFQSSLQIVPYSWARYDMTNISSSILRDDPIHILRQLWRKQSFQNHDWVTSDIVPHIATHVDTLIAINVDHFLLDTSLSLGR